MHTIAASAWIESQKKKKVSGSVCWLRLSRQQEAVIIQKNARKTTKSDGIASKTGLDRLTGQTSST